MSQTPTPAAPRRRPAPRSRRLVPCFGHAFGETLVCPCGRSWWEHQEAPAACPVDAQRRHQPRRDPEERSGEA